MPCWLLFSCFSAWRQPSGWTPSLYPGRGEGECAHPHFQRTSGSLYRLPCCIWQVLEYGNYAFLKGLENHLGMKSLLRLKDLSNLIQQNLQNNFSDELEPLYSLWTPPQKKFFLLLLFQLGWRCPSLHSRDIWQCLGTFFWLSQLWDI